MPDPEWFTQKPPAARAPKPGEHVWTLRKNGRQIDCELRFHGESYGWESQCLHDGVLAYGRRHVLKAGAMREAEEHRMHLVGEGWLAPASVVPPDEVD